MKNNQTETSNRRDFLLKSLLAGGAMVAGVTIGRSLDNDKKKSDGEKVKVLTQDGKLVEVEKSMVEYGGDTDTPTSNHPDARKGIPGRKFVMVIDLSKCKKALKCQEACHHHHNTSPEQEYLKIYKMQDSPDAAPYWMPKPCLQCEHPPCVKVCPVDATFKREDGIVLIDNERCIGCRFCMAACPYSTRVFNWTEPPEPTEGSTHHTHGPETSLPRRKGTVSKCDFCPDMIRDGKLPHCVSACPNGVFYFGDKIEDTVTNGSETVRFSQLIKDKAGYRYLEELGTGPNVYYLPPVDRLFPFEDTEESAETTHTH